MPLLFGALWHDVSLTALCFHTWTCLASDNGKWAVPAIHPHTHITVQVLWAHHAQPNLPTHNAPPLSNPKCLINWPRNTSIPFRFPIRCDSVPPFRLSALHKEERFQVAHFRFHYMRWNCWIVSHWNAESRKITEKYNEMHGCAAPHFYVKCLLSH